MLQARRFAFDRARFHIRALKARFRDQRAEFDVIKRHLRPDDVVCDIGANKGSFLGWLAKWVPDGRVVAFEPQPDLARYLTDICGSMPLRNVSVEPQAVYSQSGHLDLFMPTGHQPGASLHRPDMDAGGVTTISVPTVALDDYFDPGEKVALLKIDVEGAELAVFRGAERILRQHAPLLVFECENRHLAPGSVRDVFSYLEGLGYEGSFIRGDEVLPLASFDAAIHQRQEGDWFWKKNGYCNNFIFRRRA
jgi:FkbM family methyltransferase